MSWVEEEGEEQIAKQVQQEQEQLLQEEQRTRVELGRPRTPEPTGLGMTHLTTNNDDRDQDERLHPRSSPTTTWEQEQPSVINQLLVQ